MTTAEIEIVTISYLQIAKSSLSLISDKWWSFKTCTDLSSYRDNVTEFLYDTFIKMIHVHSCVLRSGFTYTSRIGQLLWPGFDSWHYQKKVVGLERGPLSLVSTTEELLDRKVAAPV
jgi:hypothetical protein